jgi:nucleotide-binding universal stress UspA family protein
MLYAAVAQAHVAPVESAGDDSIKRRFVRVSSRSVVMKLLIPIDGSPYSDVAISFVASRPALLATPPQIDLLNVQLPLPPRAGRAVGAEIAQSWHEAEAGKVLEPAIEKLRAAGLDPAWFHRVGHPGVVISDWAQAHGVDLVIMGSHGRTALKNLVFGSVAQFVLATSQVPVLVLRTPDAPEAESLRVGIALDGSPYGEAAADLVLARRALFGPRPEITLLHSVETYAADLLPVDRPDEGLLLPTPISIEETQRAAFEAVVAPIRERFAGAGVEVKEALLVGPAAEQIAQFAAAAPLDILVLGSHGRGALTSALMGSVAWSIAARCSTPLLMVRLPH